MKPINIIILLLTSFTSTYAQDILITKDADTIDCKITNITDDIIYFQVESRDKPSKVPIDYLYRYLYRMEWEYVGTLNEKAFEEKKISVEKQFTGNVRTAGFHLTKAGQYQMATPILGIGSIGLGVGGGLAFNGGNRNVGIGLLVASGVMSLASIITQVGSGYHTKRAGNELKFVPVTANESRPLENK